MSALGRDQLIRRALAYLAERSDGQPLDEALLPLEEQVNETYADGTDEEFDNCQNTDAPGRRITEEVISR